MRFDPSSLPFPEPFPGPFKSHRASLPVSAETSYPPAEKLDRIDLIGKIARLSNGSSGTILHVEYEAPERVALVQTFPETPSPLTRVSVDRMSPAHLPAIEEIIGDTRIQEE